MPRKKNGFRLNRKGFGLTYSCPKNTSENPIPDHQSLIDFLTLKGVDPLYIVAKELHQEGTTHWHVCVKYQQNIDSTDPRFFDHLGVHPNICDGNPGKGWEAYITKDFDYQTNYYKRSHWTVALECDTVKDAMDYLWQHEPKQMCLSASTIHENISKRMKKERPQLRYFGPFPEKFYPVDWNPATHSLLFVGPPGVGKTQFARYLLGDNDYIKSSLEGLRRVSFQKPILFDEVTMLEKHPEQSKEITDVENGGTISMRYKDVEVPPGVQRIFLHNIDFPFRNPNMAVYGRRVHVHRPFAEPQFTPDYAAL